MLKSHILKRFWFEFDIETCFGFPPGIGYGCGVTAYNHEDAMILLNTKVFNSINMPPIKFVKENVDISKLNEEHVIPNMKAPIYRGIWFPLGYE